DNMWIIHNFIKCADLSRNLETMINPKILDIGCFTGMKTIELAKISNGLIFALDVIQPYLDKLEENAQAEGVAENVEAMNKSMFSLDFDNEYFDIIWCEGAIYFIGFENGLKEWRRFLKKNGYMVISELIWLKEDPPDTLKKYWENEYPSMKSNEENLKIINNLGYTIVDWYILEEQEWWNPYTLLEKRIIELRKQYSVDPKFLEFLDINQREIDIFRKYSEYYGYAFYIIQN
ncbi:MAG: class I SAM-dependent methyltransferase, partial [Candidatus Hodarchaeota archaeon]